MGSPGIDQWVQDAPESWAKLAKGASKKSKFEDFKKKFFEGAENENKGYLKKYLTDEQLKHIYEQGLGGEQKIYEPPTLIKKEKIQVVRKGKEYTRTNNPRWQLNSKFVLQLAAKSKPKSEEYYKYLDILTAQGRTRQAAVKKIQRTRRELK